MIAYAFTDQGKVRKSNQDYVFSSDTPVGRLPNLFLVADGMGGHQGGEYASRYLVENLLTFIQYSLDEDVIALLREGILQVNRELYQESEKDSLKSGMGTTLTASVIKDGYIYVANIGDSRLYIIGEEMTQVTKDHSYVEEMVELGKMERGSEDYLRKKNIITRAVGAHPDVEIDFFKTALPKMHYVLLCTDGLTNMMDDEEIQTIVSSDLSLEEKVKSLVDQANTRGGVDNIAVILVDPQISEVKRC